MNNVFLLVLYIFLGVNILLSIPLIFMDKIKFKLRLIIGSIIFGILDIYAIIIVSMEHWIAIYSVQFIVVLLFTLIFYCLMYLRYYSKKLSKTIDEFEKLKGNDDSNE